MRRRRAGGIVASVLASVVASLLAVAGPSASATTQDISPFRGLGTWVDVYDYVPGFQEDGGPPPVTVESIDDMERLGVQTLYLQSAQDDSRLSGATVDRKLLGSFLRRAHDVGIEVVAWYLPKLAPVSADVRRIRALHEFESDGERFDALALDIEWTQGVPDPKERNAALVRFAKKARKAVDDRALGAIVLEPLLIEEVNLLYWPDFPWKKLQGYFDVWMPMSYWTNRDRASGLRDGFSYTEENIRRVRKRLGDPEAGVHAIGGIADSAATKDYLGFVKAAKKRDAIGWSIYDFNTTTSGVWARLRES